MRRLIILVVILLIILGIWSTIEKYVPQSQRFLQEQPKTLQGQPGKIDIKTEESVVIDTVKKVGPSVATVAEEDLSRQSSVPDLGPFGVFGFPNGQGPDQNQIPQGPQDIGSGFLVSSDGLIVTNKHVVSNAQAKYTVIINNDKKYDVKKIYRDPLNDVAILKIDPSQNFGQDLKPVTLGDSTNLQVGQFVIAIGTALGEFRNTVTTGVISGLGRGITAGSVFQQYAERLDNVIQTDAAINPGNSGGPLLNSSGQVIGINTAVASEGQNIGFALPINVVKDSLKNFNETGQFNRPYLGVSYKMISRDLAMLNSLPEGAYVQRVIADSAADKAGIKDGDIITKIDGQKVEAQKNELAQIVSKKKVGDTITLTVWRQDSSSKDSTKGDFMDLKVTLQQAPEQ